MYAFDAIDEILPYTSIGLILSDADAALTAIFYGTRVHIEFPITHNPGAENDALRREFSDRKKAIERYDTGAIEAFEDWLVKPCLSLLRHLALRRRAKGLVSLHEYFHGKTLCFCVRPILGRLVAEKISSDSKLTAHLRPMIPFSNNAVSAARELGVRFYSAADLEIIRPPHVSDWEYDAVPTVVRDTLSGSVFYLKVVYDRGSFVRELETYIVMQRNPCCASIQVSRFAGLAQWKGEEVIAGLLIEYIPDANTLDRACKDASPAERERWMKQICETVEVLHSCDVVWSDVKPPNIVIDAESRAWVLDFGGGYNPTWVEERFAGTKRGDLKAMARIARFLEVPLPALLREDS